MTDAPIRILTAEEWDEMMMAPLREYWRLQSLAYQRNSLGLNCLGGDAYSIGEISKILTKPEVT